MGTLDRYITTQALRSATAVVLALLSLITLFALFEELDERETTYTFEHAVWYVLKTMPRRLDEILIYGLFLGYLLTLGRLAENNELTICRVAGMSPLRLMGSLTPSLLMWLALSVAIAEWVAPASERSANVDKLTAIYGAEALDQRGGLWLRAGSLFMRVRAIDEDGKIHGITQYWLDDNRALTQIVQAETGRFDTTTAQWNLVNGTLTEFRDDQTTETKFLARTWENSITPDVLASQAFLEASKMSMQALYRQIEFARTQQLGVSEYELAFWSRVLKPVTFFGLTLFALAVVIGPLREVGMGLRLTFGIFAGLGFKYLQDLFAPAAIVFNIPAVIAILIPIALYWGVAWHYIRRNA